MEIWNYINVLRKSERLPFRKRISSDINEKLEALENLKIKGNTSIISELIPILKTDNLELRNKTFEVIKCFYEKIYSGKALYQTLKYCQIDKKSLNIFKQKFSTDEYVVLVSIATYNFDGYVREKAIDELSQIKNCKEILNPLLHRLSDWVVINRNKSEKIIRNLKQSENLDYFVEQIFVIENLKKVSRTDLTEINNELLSFIIDENRDEVLLKFRDYSDKIRVLLTRHLISTTNLNLSVLNIFLKDKNFIVRSLVLKRFELLTNQEIQKLLADKSSKIRIQTLYSLEKTSNISEIAFNFLADSSASIRNFSRFILKDQNIDFKNLYLINLLENKHIEGSLHGLKEADGKEFANNVIPFLKSSQIKIVKAAFNVIQEFKSTTAYDFAFTNMDSEFEGIRKISIEYLYKKNPTLEVIQKARTIFHSENLPLRKLMLKFFSKIGKYRCLNEILIGTIDEREEIRILSRAYLKDWILKSSKYFIPPTQIEVEMIREALLKVKNQIDNNEYLEIKILKEIEFRIR